MNILIINHDLLVRENLVPYEVLHAIRPDWHIKVLVPPKTRMIGKVIDRIPETVLDIVCVPAFFWRKPQIQLYHPRQLHKLLLEWSPDLVHLNQEPFNFASLEILQLLRTMTKRPKFIVRSSLLEGVKVSTKIESIFRRVEKTVLNWADGVECINSMSQEYIHKHAPKLKTAVIPWSRDERVFSPGRDSIMRRELGLHGFVVGYFGHFTTQKDLPTLFHAVRTLLQSGVTLQLLLVGDGPEKRRLQELAGEIGLEKAIIWQPAVDPTQIPQYYRSLDLFVLPSRTEGHSVEVFGRVLIEAMACGVPVVGSTSGAIPEVIGEGGLLFREGDVDALVGVIREVMRGAWPPKDETAPGRRRFLAHFTHSAKAEKLATFYEQILPPHP